MAGTVEENQALLAAFRALRDGGQQRGAHAVLQFLAPCIDATHRRRRFGDGPLRQFQQLVTAALPTCMVESLQRGRGRAQHDRHGALMGAPDGDIARRVAQSLLLLEGGVMLLVDDDQAEPRQRRKHRQARAENDVGATFESLYDPRPRRIGHAAVRRDHPGAGKRAATRPSSCGVSAISGTSISACLPCARSARSGADHFGLAAAGDAMQQGCVTAKLAARSDGDSLLG